MRHPQLLRHYQPKHTFIQACMCKRGITYINYFILFEVFLTMFNVFIPTPQCRAHSVIFITVLVNNGPARDFNCSKNTFLNTKNFTRTQGSHFWLKFKNKLFKNNSASAKEQRLKFQFKNKYLVNAMYKIAARVAQQTTFLAKNILLHAAYSRAAYYDSHAVTRIQTKTFI